MTAALLAAALAGRPTVFYECGCCWFYHPAGFTGDCRNDDYCYQPEDLPEGWEEVT